MKNDVREFRPHDLFIFETRPQSDLSKRTGAGALSLCSEFCETRLVLFEARPIPIRRPFVTGGSFSSSNKQVTHVLELANAVDGSVAHRLGFEHEATLIRWAVAIDDAIAGLDRRVPTRAVRGASLPCSCLKWPVCAWIWVPAGTHACCHASTHVCSLFRMTGTRPTPAVSPSVDSAEANPAQ